MVIQCSACDTRFKISDDKVKSGPVKVRCSKCKEIFTVQPPEEEQIAAVEEAPAAPAAPESSSSSSPSLDDVDWGSLNSDETDTAADESTETDEDVSSSDFSFGDDDEAAATTDNEFSFGDDEDAATEESDEFSFGDDETEPASDEIDDAAGGISDFSFGDDETTEEDETESDDAFSFGGSTEATADDFGFDDAVGEGAQDEFSFDDAPTSTDDADDFDWDGTGGNDTDSGDEPGFGVSSDADGSLDFSSLEMATDEPDSVEMEEPTEPEPAPVRDESRPTSVKGPQKSGAKGRKPGKRTKTKKKSGPLRSILILLLLLLSIAGGGLFGLKQTGFWSGDFTELQTVDYVTAAQTGWEKVMNEINKLAGTEVSSPSSGTITVTEMAGKYSQNNSAGTLFVIDGTIRNDYPTKRSAIAVVGILYDEAGVAVRKQKAYCGNALSNKLLQTESLAELQKRSSNPFGDSFSNDNVAPGALVPFTIVFSDLPDNLSTFNVEIAE